MSGVARLASFLSSFGLAAGPLVWLAFTAGCAPTTTYRYSGFVPAVRPLAWDGRAAATGTLRIEGTITHAAVDENPSPQLHDTALMVPQWTIDGTAMLTLTSALEVGIRAAGADYGWSTPSAVGTMPVPSRSSMWGVGPELRLAIPFDDKNRFALGIAANMMRYETPYAEWTLTGPGSANGQTTPCLPSSTCVDGYSLFDSRSEAHLVYTFGLYPSIALGDKGEYGHVFALLGGTNGFRNDGFTDTPTNGSTLSVIGPVWMIGGGYGFSYERMHVSAMLFRPLTDGSSAVDYSVGFQLSVGVNADLWSSDNDRD